MCWRRSLRPTEEEISLTAVRFDTLANAWDRTSGTNGTPPPWSCDDIFGFCLPPFSSWTYSFESDKMAKVIRGKLGRKVGDRCKKILLHSAHAQTMLPQWQQCWPLGVPEKSLARQWFDPWNQAWIVISCFLMPKVWFSVLLEMSLALYTYWLFRNAVTRPRLERL